MSGWGRFGKGKGGEGLYSLAASGYTREFCRRGPLIGLSGDLRSVRRLRSSVVEHFLGKEEVTGSNPVVGSSRVGH